MEKYAQKRKNTDKILTSTETGTKTFLPMFLRQKTFLQ